MLDPTDTIEQKLASLFASRLYGDTVATTPAPPLTLQTIRDAVEQLQADWLIVYCAPNECIEPGVIYKVTDDLAALGFFVVCHPDTMPAVRDELFRHQVRLRHVADMDESELRRRATLAAKKMVVSSYTYSSPVWPPAWHLWPCAAWPVGHGCGFSKFLPPA